MITQLDTIFVIVGGLEKCTLNAFISCNRFIITKLIWTLPHEINFMKPKTSLQNDFIYV